MKAHMELVIPAQAGIRKSFTHTDSAGAGAAGGV